MAHIVVIGAGIGGLPTAYELRHQLSRQHCITLISDQPKFTFIPSLPWVALGLKCLNEIQLDINKPLKKRGINWIQGKVKEIDPHHKQLIVGETRIHYDFVVIATGASLDLEAVPGLGPETGYTQSVCNPHHALLALQAWNKFLENPGPLVVGAVPKASCFGPAYEFALLADFRLRQLGLRHRVPITLVTPEPYAGHLGIGGMANSQKIVKNLLFKRGVNLLENQEITEITSHHIRLADGQSLPFDYAMILPPFNGPKFVRSLPDLGDSRGFLPVLPTYQHPLYESIYAVGVVVQISPPESTPIPVGVPKTGQMTEAMGMAVVHNIAIKLGEKPDSLPVKPTLEAICFADFGDTGVVFLADQVLPDPVTGQRRRAVALEGTWVSWSKTLFEKFFLAKMRWGVSVPFFELWGLKILGLELIEPILPKDFSHLSPDNNPPSGVETMESSVGSGGGH